MSSYRLNTDAAHDLEGVWDYIARDNVHAADGWIGQLRESFQLIAQHPGIGHPRADLRAYDLLVWPVGAYLVIYRVQLEFVEIVAVTQGARDLPRLLSDRG